MESQKSPTTNLSPNKELRDNSTQTDAESNKGKGITPIQNETHDELFTDDLPTPDYRKKINEGIQRRIFCGTLEERSRLHYRYG